MADQATDPRIDKKRITMRSAVLSPPQPGQTEDQPPAVEIHQAVDYVREHLVDAYVADAVQHWQQVWVSEEYDAGPGGYDGATFVPNHLDVPDAGTLYPATEAEEATA
jgi:hypothetical protein